jgi:hypothetical protein
MKESRLTLQLDALAEALTEAALPLSRRKPESIDDHVSSALRHATIARQSFGPSREHHVKLANAYVDRAMAHKGSQPYHEGHPLRAKMAALHATLKGL